MAEAEETEEDAPKGRSGMPMILGLVLALLGGGAGFYATWSGMILGDDGASMADDAAGREDRQEEPKVAYVAVDPLVISLPAGADADHLRFRAHLEVPVGAQEEVESLLPRVIDVLNSYLRAVEPGDLENPAALTRLRSQMLRRVQVVTGDGNVNDLLIMEFVLT